MVFALSSNWNAKRHQHGEALVDEALSLGFQALELGYNTTEELVPGIRARLSSGSIQINSVHAFCPVPLGAPHGYPELHFLASNDEDERALAAILLRQTREFAEKIGAKAVVLHAGRIFLNSSLFGNLHSGKLEDIADEEGTVLSPRYQKILHRAQKRRTKRAKKVYDQFCITLDKILPTFQKSNLLLCLENLPSIEGFPDETEIESLCKHFEGSPLRYWHDMGHGQVRANLRWSEDHVQTCKRLLPIIGGIHIHDTASLTHDHLPPGEGAIPFEKFSFLGDDRIIKVFEPSPDVPAAALKKSLLFVRSLWEQNQTKTEEKSSI